MGMKGFPSSSPCQNRFVHKALIQKLMNVPRVQAKTQIRSESLKPRENTINEQPRKVVRLRLVVRQQQREAGDGI